MWQDSKGYNQIMQPSEWDKYSWLHLVLAFALTFLLSLPYALTLLICISWQDDGASTVIAVLAALTTNLIGITYEFGQATGYKSQEGMDVSDMLMNLIGSLLAMIVLMMV